MAKATTKAATRDGEKPAKTASTTPTKPAAKVKPAAKAKPVAKVKSPKVKASAEPKPAAVVKLDLDPKPAKVKKSKVAKAGKVNAGKVKAPKSMLRQTSDAIAQLASDILADRIVPTIEQIKSIAASALGHDETKAKKAKRKSPKKS